MRTILGLDLGTNSIGWAVINSVIKEQTERIWIEMAGSRIIPMDAAILGDFDKGNSISQTAERTRFRGGRRLRERQLLRRERLHKVLKILGFLPEHYLKGIDFEKHTGKFLSGSEPKLPWVKDRWGNTLFYFRQRLMKCWRILQNTNLHWFLMVKKSLMTGQFIISVRKL